MPQLKTFCAVLAALTLLSACGSKGPLYLPKPEPIGAAQDSAKAGAEVRS